MKNTIAMIVGFLFLVSTASPFPDVQVVEAKKENLRMCPELTVLGEVSLAANPIAASDLSKDSIPRFISCPDGPWGIALGAPKTLYLFDPSCLAILRALPVPDAASALDLFPGSGDCLVGHRRGEKWVNSRVELATGRILWSFEHDFVSGYFHSGGRGRVVPLSKYLGSSSSGNVFFYNYSVPILFTLLKDKNQVLVIGLRISGSRGVVESILSFSPREDTDWDNRVVTLDASTGKVVSDERFDLRRDINPFMKCFIDLDRNEFRILDSGSGTYAVSGKFSPGDVLAKKGFAPSIDLRNVIRDLVTQNDVHPLIFDGGLFFVSHARAGSPVASDKLKTSWVKYDLNGNRIGPLENPPPSSPSFAVPNHGEAPWPLVLLGITSKYMGPKAESFVVVNKDGSISESPWPKLKANICYNVFHSGQNIYLQGPKGWFRFMIGEENAVPVPWDEVKAVAHPGLSWGYSDSNRANDNLPANLPPIVKKYVDYLTGVQAYGSIDMNNYSQIRTLRVWGSDPRKDMGDILLVPALLKDSSAILVGISLPQNKIAFYLPMLHIKGLPQEDFKDGVSFLYGLKYLDDRRALLVVGETLNSYKVYSLGRPPMPPEEPSK